MFRESQNQNLKKVVDSLGIFYFLKNLTNLKTSNKAKL